MEIVVEYFGKLTVIHLDGEFFLNNIQDVEEVWKRESDKNQDVIAFDCIDLTYVDSSAIGTMVKMLNDSTARSFEMVFYDIKDSILRIFSTAKLNKIFNIYSKEEFEEKYKDMIDEK